jgi:glycosyltransferase involved in cell wall biosynthesis
VRPLVVCQYFWPESFRINDIVGTLVAEGVEVEVLTGKPNYPEGQFYPGHRFWGFTQEVFRGATVFRIPLIPRGHESRLGLILNYLSFILLGLTAGPWVLRGRKFDVVFVYGLSPILQAIPAVFLGWIKRAPVVLLVQDLWPESLSATGYLTNKSVLGLVERVVRFIYRHVDLILVQSEAFVGPVKELAPETPVEYYPNSVDASFSSPASLGGGAHLPGLHGGFSVVFAGNIGTAQAVEVIVEAATLLRDNGEVRFVVVGDGSRRDWMLRQVEERELDNVYLPGRLPVESMPGIMQAASALLVTLADQPIFAATVPNKIQAYMAAGRPIIACLGGEGARLVLAAKSGLAVPPEDGRALAEAVLELSQMSTGDREEMGANGRAFFGEHFDHDHLVDRLICHMEQVVEERAEARIR